MPTPELGFGRPGATGSPPLPPQHAHEAALSLPKRPAAAALRGVWDGAGAPPGPPGLVAVGWGKGGGAGALQGHSSAERAPEHTNT